MQNKQPLISIITVVYNGVDFLEETIQSVLNQSYEHIEYIVIDGGSTDGTVDIIKKYEDKIDYWVSERDDGIYDAMNKGMVVATGDFALFLNGGDRLYESGTLTKVCTLIEKRDIAYFGRAKITSPHSTWLHPTKSISQKDIPLWLKSEAPNHQAILFPKIFYKQYFYDLRFKIFADAGYKDKVKSLYGFSFIDIIICEFEFGGVSSSFDEYRHIKTMMHEAWIMGKEQKKLPLAIKRILIYNIKYILRNILNEKRYLNLIKKIRA